MDEELRALERRARAGDEEAARELQRRLLRAGRVEPWEVELGFAPEWVRARPGHPEVLLAGPGALWRCDGQELDTVRGLPPEPHRAVAVAVDADGRVARVFGDELRLLPTVGPELRRALPLSRVQAAAFDARAARVAITDGAAVALVDVASGAVQAPISQAPQPVLALALSPDAQLLLTLDGQVARVVRTADGAEVARLPVEDAPRPGQPLAAAWAGAPLTLSPRGLVLWDLARAAPVAECEAAPRGGLLASPDGTRVLVGSREQRCLLVREVAPGLSPQLELHRAAGLLPCFLDDGRLAFAHEDVLHALEASRDEQGRVLQVELQPSWGRGGVVYGAPPRRPPGPSDDDDLA